MVGGRDVLIWKLLAIGFAAATAVLAVIAIWQLADRNRVRRRFAEIVDLDREIAARRLAFRIEATEAQRAFEAESAARRRAVDGELAEHAAQIQLARVSATRELADTMRAASEVYAHHATTRAILVAELTALRAKIAALKADLKDAQARRQRASWRDLSC